MSENSVNGNPLQPSEDALNLVKAYFQNTHAAVRFNRLPVIELQHRFDALGTIFGDKYSNWSRCVLLLFQTEETSLRKAAELDKQLPDGSWREVPEMLILNSQSVPENFNLFNRIFGNTWKIHRSVTAELAKPTDELSHRIDTLDRICQGRHWKKEVILISYFSEEIEQRAARATELFGNDKWTKRPQLLIISEDELVKRAGNLSSEIGNRWQTIPELLEIPADTIRAKAQQLDELFGSYNWRGSPKLLLSDGETLRSYAASHTSVYGSDHWMSFPVLASVTPRTFDSSIRALRSLEFEFDTSTGPSILQLLALKMDTKRYKAALLRSHLLGHKHIPAITPGSAGTIYDYRTRMSAHDKAEEAKEIDQIRELIRRKPDLLRSSYAHIRRLKPHRKLE